MRNHHRKSGIPHFTENNGTNVNHGDTIHTMHSPTFTLLNDRAKVGAGADSVVIGRRRSIG